MITAFALLIDMPEFGTLGNGQALYMSALVAMRFNPELKAKYNKLKAAGKASKVAIIEIMRKLIVLVNALLRDNLRWNTSAP